MEMETLDVRGGRRVAGEITTGGMPWTLRLKIASSEGEVAWKNQREESGHTGAVVEADVPKAR